MIKVTLYRDKKVAVFGLGKSGIGSVKALAAGGTKVFAWDDNVSSREVLQKENIPGVTIQDPNFYTWKEISALILAPGVPLTHPKPHPIVMLAREANCPIICDIELLNLSMPDARFVAITGTNGKSTTTALIGHILKSAGIQTEIGGNIGISALDLEELGKGGVYVIETSSFQLDLIQKARFDVSLLLNITPDHLDRHGNMEGYTAAKERIFMNQQKQDTAIIGVDDKYSEELYKKLKSKMDIGSIISISNTRQLKEGIYMEDSKLYDNFFSGDERVFEFNDLKSLLGTHNWQNIAAAYAACFSLGVSKNIIIQSIKTFPGLKHRIEKVGEVRGVKFINDSKATNAEAAEKAILCFRDIYWIAGGLAKEGGIDALKKYFSRIRHVFLIGKAQDDFARTLEGKVSYTKSGDLKNALEQAAAMAMANKEKSSQLEPVVLLSPACASFDQWKNFEERGDAFRNMVQELTKGIAA